MGNWKNKLVRGGAAALLLATVLSADTTLAAEPLRDVENGSWYEGNVQWAVTKGIVNGYEDQTFRPYAQVSEAEFLTMLLRSYGAEVRVLKAGEAWFGPYYEKAQSLAIPAALKTEDRLQPILRGQVAAMIAAYFGKRLTATEAVQFVLDKGMSNGKTAPTVEGYRMNDRLSRAEAVTFVRNVVVFAESEEGRKLLAPADGTKKPAGTGKQASETADGLAAGSGSSGGSSGSNGSSGGENSTPGPSRPQTPVLTEESRTVLDQQAKTAISQLGLTIQESGQSLRIPSPEGGGSGLIQTRTDDRSGEIQILEPGSPVLIKSAYTLLKAAGAALSESDFTHMVRQVDTTGSSTAVKLGSQMITVVRAVPSGSIIIRYAGMR
ncbi:S-layer homology domain-containing protein [Paenibacillus sp. GD4]|uniref:S-layer homology domain-containing protein n=1 Tax=Paenibacillus sp. GD4 TaxID=3068890 RepID=UPI00279673E1|nr:S-layer homology domain-containing protein [Paenibacillus sp. GD4]MDQ1910107.1 S-layer homology domain-containing protein [Paenibacillus sp. GD4]